MDKKVIYAEDAIIAAECIAEHHAITPYKTMAEAMDYLKHILNGMPSAQPKKVCVAEIKVDGDELQECVNRAMEKVVQQQEQPEPCEEIQHILDYLNNVVHPLVSPEHWNIYSKLYDMIAALPSEQPPQAKGRWIHDGYDIPHGVDWMHCSVCGRREPYVPAAMTNFCPNCGADMRGEQG